MNLKTFTMRTLMTISGKMLSSKTVTPHLYFAAALQGQADHQPHQETAATTNYTETAPKKKKEHATGESVQVPTVNNDTLDLLRAMISTGDYDRAQGCCI
jgi:hypothetical protein